MSEIGNHLWQSTLFTFAVAAACLILRRHSPRLRYWLLLAASLKFLLPFSIFIAAGEQMTSPVSQPLFTALAVEQVTAAIAPASRPSPPPRRNTPWQPVVWAAGTLAVATWRIALWRKFSAIRRSAAPVPLDFPVPAFRTEMPIEPGIFGAFRPVLLLPQALAGRLPADQFQAILAHECCHVRYRDNLTAAVHTAVEALFWFHPLVWWIGLRMIRERERHCDEAVLAAGNDPETYARSIVAVCRQCLSSPASCSAGITASGLKNRIVAIMTHRMSRPLTATGKAALAGAALATLSIPFFIGALRAQTLPPPPKYRFEVASVHPSKALDNSNRLGPTPQGGLRADNVTVTQLIAFAFGVRPFLIVDAPRWASTQRFDVVATPESAGEPPPGTTAADRDSFRERMRQRVQALLIDRFGLVLRAEKRVMPVYKLVIAKRGHKLTPSSEGETRRMESNSMMLRGTAVDMNTVADSLAGILMQPVLDETALTGTYNFHLRFADHRLEAAPDTSGGAASEPAGLPSLFTAITEQIGLRLETARAPAPVFVVEHVRRPSEN